MFQISDTHCNSIFFFFTRDVPWLWWQIHKSCASQNPETSWRWWRHCLGQCGRHFYKGHQLPVIASKLLHKECINFPTSTIYISIDIYLLKLLSNMVKDKLQRSSLIYSSRYTPWFNIFLMSRTERRSFQEKSTW